MRSRKEILEYISRTPLTYECVCSVRGYMYAYFNMDSAEFEKCKVYITPHGASFDNFTEWLKCNIDFVKKGDFVTVDDDVCVALTDSKNGRFVGTDGFEIYGVSIEDNDVANPTDRTSDVITERLKANNISLTMFSELIGGENIIHF